MNQNQFEETFPSLLYVKDKINELKKLDLRAIEYSILKKRVNDCFFNIPIVPGTIIEGARLYRARTFPYNGIPYSKISEISLPPKNAVSTFGRANKPFYPLFYCASNIELALNEVCRNANNPENTYIVKWIVVGEWLVKKGQNLSVSNLCYNKNALDIRDDLKKSKYISQKILHNIPKENPPLSDNTINVTTALLEFFSDEFAKEIIITPDDYKLSVVYTDLLFDLSRGLFDGVNYPSVASKFKGDNIVLSQKCLENKLELINAFIVTVGFTKTDPFMNYAILEKSKSFRGDEITWEKIFNR
ncbi:MAG: RES domain-containing protein [Bacteroidales bacterium]|nr:RES domain-containing protein [Bacteroidales bacterium]